jgi:hypothetical protein
MGLGRRLREGRCRGGRFPLFFKTPDRFVHVLSRFFQGLDFFFQDGHLLIQAGQVLFQGKNFSRKYGPSARRIPVRKTRPYSENQTPASQKDEQAQTDFFPPAGRSPPFV